MLFLNPRRWFGLLAAALALNCLPLGAAEYAVVVSESTYRDPSWSNVVATLRAKHQAQVVAVAAPPKDATPALKALQPRYVAFVARPEELDAAFVREVHLASRAMDEDPYADFFWGIITGYTPADALRIAKAREPLIVRRSINTTGVNGALFDEMLTFSDANPPGNWNWKRASGNESGREDRNGPGHATRFTEGWTNCPPDVLVTSGHATEVNLELPFGMGSLICWSNQLYALDRTNFNRYVRAMSANRAEGGLWFCSPQYPELCRDWILRNHPQPLPISTNPKVFLGAGNCLIGDAMRSPHSMVVTWLSAGGANQFVGYTVPTWYGKGGWGTLGLWVGSGGQLTLAEACYLNNQQVVKRLLELDPEFRDLEIDEDTALQITGEKRGQPTAALRRISAVVGKLKTDERRDAIGLLYDRDSLALYGDPKWEARVDSSKAKPALTWEWQHGAKEDWSLKLTAAAGHKSEGKQALPLPAHLNQPTLEGAAVEGMMLNDEFVLVPNSVVEAGGTRVLVFHSQEAMKRL